MVGSWWDVAVCDYARAPELSNFEIGEERVTYGVSKLTIRFNYFDPDGDVSEKSKIHYEIRKHNDTEYCFIRGDTKNFKSPEDIFIGKDNGWITFSIYPIEIYPSYNFCTAEILVTLTDDCGKTSAETMETEILNDRSTPLIRLK